VATNIDQILDQIAELIRADKDLLLDGADWRRTPRAGGFDALEFLAPIAISGVIINGLQARVSCRSDLTEKDVHAQLQLYIPAISAFAHLQRVEWRPNARHTNTASAPAALRFKTFSDRWYDFGLNRRLGVAGLRQTCTMIAQEPPRSIGSFNDLLAFLGEVWKIKGAVRIPAPPWEERLV
jgi:hypothetical protein